jgi:hypothetical protein
MISRGGHALPKSTNPEPAQQAAPVRVRGGLAKLRETAPAAPDVPTQPPPADRPPDDPPVEQPVEQLPVEAVAADRPRVRGLLTGVIALAVAAVVLLTFVILRWDGGSAQSGKPAAAASTDAGAATGADPDADERLAAVRAARQFAVSFFTYDYRNIDAYFRRIEALSTGSFRADFVSKEKTLKTVVSQLKTVAKGQVPDAGAGIFALADGKAVAFVAANLNASNAVTKNGQQRYRVKLSLQKVHGAWLVSNFAEVA